MENIIRAMASEIAKLRTIIDIDYGEYQGDNADIYNIEKIIEEFKGEIK